MPYDPNRHHRRSIRLPGYDYTRPGAYFITICAHGRAALFGAVGGGAMCLNDAGRMVERRWGELGRKFPAVTADAFVVMPDHMHGIVILGGTGAGFVGPIADINAGGDAGAGFVGPIADINAGGYANPPLRDGIDDSIAGINGPNDNASVGADVSIRPRRAADDGGAGHDDAGARAVPLSRIIQWFKIMTTAEYIRGVKQSGWAAFDKRIWQRGYYEHIIRDDRSLARIRSYIAENPARWANDRDHLDALLARMGAKE
jgi:REP element-mobilizing transposase RayT